MKSLFQAIWRFFRSIGEFFLGKAYDIPYVEERRPTNIYQRLEYLQKTYPENADLQEFCEEVQHMLLALSEKRKIEPGAFVNFFLRMFPAPTDMYVIETMLWEVNEPVYKDTINRKAHETNTVWVAGE